MATLRHLELCARSFCRNAKLETGFKINLMPARSKIWVPPIILFNDFKSLNVEFGIYALWLLCEAIFRYRKLYLSV